LTLAAALHPTPAVGGWPRAAADGLIDELEGMERGWYAGAVGWIDGRGDGEFAVALRCGLLWEDGARLYAGVGVMPDSDPARELVAREGHSVPHGRAAPEARARGRVLDRRTHRDRFRTRSRGTHLQAGAGRPGHRRDEVRREIRGALE